MSVNTSAISVRWIPTVYLGSSSFIGLAPAPRSLPTIYPSNHWNLQPWAVCRRPRNYCHQDQYNFQQGIWRYPYDNRLLFAIGHRYTCPVSERMHQGSSVSFPSCPCRRTVLSDGCFSKNPSMNSYALGKVQPDWSCDAVGMHSIPVSSIAE